MTPPGVDHLFGSDAGNADFRLLFRIDLALPLLVQKRFLKPWRVRKKDEG